MHRPFLKSSVRKLWKLVLYPWWSYCSNPRYLDNSWYLVGSWRIWINFYIGRLLTMQKKRYKYCTIVEENVGFQLNPWFSIFWLILAKNSTFPFFWFLGFWSHTWKLWGLTTASMLRNHFWQCLEPYGMHDATCKAYALPAILYLWHWDKSSFGVILVVFRA